MIDYKNWLLISESIDIKHLSYEFPPEDIFRFAVNVAKDVLPFIKNKEAITLSKKIIAIIEKQPTNELVNLAASLEFEYNGTNPQTDEAEAILCFLGLAELGVQFLDDHNLSNLWWLVSKASFAKFYHNTITPHYVYYNRYAKILQSYQSKHSPKVNKEVIKNLLNKKDLDRTDFGVLFDMLNDDENIVSHDGNDYTFNPIPMYKSNSIENLVNIMWDHKDHILHILRRNIK